MGNTDYLVEHFGLSAKVAMVIGGNSGIGLVIAKNLAKAGVDLFIFVYSMQNTEEITQEIEAMGGKVKFAQEDLSIEEDAMGAVEKCIEAYGRIDILVNNAGTSIELLY